LALSGRRSRRLRHRDRRAFAGDAKMNDSELIMVIVAVAICVVAALIANAIWG
jgi:hypothetical protein